MLISCSGSFHRRKLTQNRIKNGGKMPPLQSNGDEINRPQAIAHTTRFHNIDQTSNIVIRTQNSLSKFLSHKTFLHRKVLLVLSWTILLAGCQVHEPQCRKSIRELYSDAVVASQTAMKQPDVCLNPQPGSFGSPVHPQPNGVPIMVPMDVPPATSVPAESRTFQPQLVVPPQSGTSATGITTGPIRSVAHRASLLPVSTSQNGWKPSGQGNLKFQPLPPAHRGIRQVSGVESGAKITEFLEETDIRQALQAIASQAQVSLIIDEQVTGFVTATIEDASFESALKSLLMPLGLIHRKISESEYLIGIPDPETALFARMSQRINFRPNHVSPTELVELLTAKEQKFVRPVDNRNYVLIEAPEETANAISRQLQLFDTPVPQVELEAIVCVVSPDHGFKSGLDWGHAVKLDGADALSLGMQGLAFNGVGSLAGAADAFADFAITSAFVKLLAQEGYLAIRASPRVTARDGDQAHIKITRESFFSTQPQNDNQFFRQDIQQVEAGIELDITPVVRGNNITMKIEKAEVSEDIRTSSINTDITENPYPSINRRTVSTTVHVKAGETIVIGGLVQRQMVDRIAKIPVLGDIPGLGKIFQTIEQTQQDAEVVIFISPKLVNSCM